MRRNVLCFLVAAAIVAAFPVPARAAEWTRGTKLLTFSGGSAVPLTSLADRAPSGWTVALEFEKFVASQCALGADLAFVRSGKAPSGARFSWVMAGAHVKYFTSALGPIRPHLASGVAGYLFLPDAHDEWLQLKVLGVESQPEHHTRYGVSAGAGFTYRTGRQGEVGVEAAFHHVLDGAFSPGSHEPAQALSLVARLSYYL